MRAKEFLADFEGINLAVEEEEDDLMVRAMAGGKEMGHAYFVKDGKTLLPQDLEIDPRYQGQGIARVLYDYTKSLGYDIRRSNQQTDAGKAFWQRHKPGQNVWEAETQIATAKQVLAYINQTHHEPMTAKLTTAIQAYPQWELRQVPLRNLNIPDKEYDDEEQEPESDPYGRVMAVDAEHAGEVSQDLVDRNPIVIDANKYIIDGNHRAWAAKNLLSRNYIQAWKPVKQIKEIARIPQGDFGDADTLKLPKYDIEKKELPGGAGLTYAVGRPGPEDLEIMIFDGDTLAAELDLFATQDVTGAWRVNTVAVDPKYRSRGLGKALYGIALSILKLTVEAGDTQTRHGQRMWVMLNSIPGVEVLGYNMERTEKYQPRPGDDIVAQDDTWTRYTFPVKSGVNSMRSARRGTGMYSSMASMIARWTGK